MTGDARKERSAIDTLRAARSAHDDELLALVQRRSRRFDRQVRQRDWGEIGVSAVVALIFAPQVVHGVPLARLGATIVLVGLVVIAVRLHRARAVTHPAGIASEAALPVTSVLRAERRRVSAQIALLDGVLGWYVTPLCAGSLLMVVGNRGMSRFTLGYIVFVVLVGWGTVALNARVVRQTLRPMHDRLSTLLIDLEATDR